MCYRRYERVTCVAVMLALAFYYTHFFLTPWYQFTSDPYEHVKYIRILADQERIPKPLETSATRHPPTYYMMAAALYRLAEWSDIADPVKVVRHLSIALFMVFILCNVELLRLFFAHPGPSYYAGLALLLYWPLGVTISGRINCDLLLYAGQSGVLLALACWFKTENIRALTWALIATAICLLAKNTGIIMVVLTITVWLYEMVRHRLKNWRQFFIEEHLLSIAFIFSCYAITHYHAWITGSPITEVEHHSQTFFWQSLLTFDPVLLLTDVSVGDSQGMFWNVVLHSLLLGHVLPWKLMNSLIVFNVCWICVLGYLLWGLRGVEAALSAQGRKLALTFIAYITLTLAGMIYMMLQSGNLLYADAHYMYPVVGIIALTFSWVMERSHLKHYNIQYRLGSVLAIIFTCLSVMLFAAQWLL